jgi:hypothetical protein
MTDEVTGGVTRYRERHGVSDAPSESPTGIRDQGSGTRDLDRGLGGRSPPTPAKPPPPSSATVVLTELQRLGGVAGHTWDADRVEALAREHGTGRLVAMVRAAAGDTWFQAQHAQRFRGDVIFGPTQVRILLARTAHAEAKTPVPPALRDWAKQRPAVGATCPGGTCAWCNAPQVFRWDGEDWQPDPAHQRCRDEAKAWDRKRGMPG